MSGSRVVEPARQVVAIRLSRSALGWLTDEAGKAGMSRSALIRVLLTLGIQSWEKQRR